MEFCDIGTAKIAYRIFGTPPISIIIESAINSCNAEWWEFCAEPKDHSVLVYDRAGYGESPFQLFKERRKISSRNFLPY